MKDLEIKGRHYDSHLKNTKDLIKIIMSLYAIREDGRIKWIYSIVEPPKTEIGRRGHKKVIKNLKNKAQEEVGSLMSSSNFSKGTYSLSFLNSSGVWKK